MRNVFVAGIGMTRFAKQPNRSIKDLTAEAVGAALADAALAVGDIDVAYFGNAVAGSITGQEMVLGQVALRAMGVERIPIFNIENACASSSSAFHIAWQSVASGASDRALVVGAEKMTHIDKRRSFRAIEGAIDQDTLSSLHRGESQGRSALMDIYAEEAREYMERSGATVQDFAAVAVKNQHNGSLNPAAQYGQDVSIEDVLATREIVWPLTLLMCSPISDGAAAVVLTSRRGLRSSQPQVRVRASVVSSGVRPTDKGETATSLAAEAAYTDAGVGPTDIDCAEVHDAAAPAELRIYEQLGFVAPGDGPALLRSGATQLGGKLPVNSSGGLLARGHPIGATGLAQLCEAVLQLRGHAGARQVDNPRLALTQNAGGYMQGDNLACAVHILGRS
jgi:acetyl-CoA acyltransferase